MANILPSNQLNAISEYVFITKYSRYDQKKKRRETWDEAINRVRDMHLQRYGTRGIEEDINWAFEQVREKKILPSMRSMQFGGEAILQNDARMYNCAYTHADRPRFFSEAMWMLLSGVGVGFSVQKQHVAKLPRLIKHKSPDEKEIFTYTVGDTIEGWADSLDVLMSTYWRGTPNSSREVFFDFSKIRRKGSWLKTSGGRAPGAAPLRAAIKRIKRILREATQAGQEVLRPIQVYDIVMMAADAVLSGGIRRCIAEGSRVQTKYNGFKPIENIIIGDLVNTNSGWKKVTNTFKQGIQKVVRIQHQDGYLDCTKNHRVAVLNDHLGSISWKYASNLIPGDRLAHFRNISEGIKTDLPKWEYKKPLHSTTCKSITIPILDEQIAWFIGLVHGDGYVYLSSRAGQVTVAVAPECRKQAEEVVEIFNRFGVNAHISYPTKKNNVHRIVCKSKQLASYFHKFVKQPKTTIRIPNFIKNSTFEIRAAYLKGVLDSDGCVKNRPQQCVCTVYLDFARDIHNLYYSLGICTRFKKLTRDSSAPKHWQDKYGVSPINLKDKRLINKTTKIGYKTIVEAKPNTHCNNLPQSMVDVTSFTKKEYNYNNKYVLIDQLDKLFPGYNICPIEVVKIDQLNNKTNTYDIEVEDDHCFTCEGILVHNSATISLFSHDDEEMMQAKIFSANNVKVLSNKRKDGHWLIDYGEGAMMAWNLKKKGSKIEEAEKGDEVFITWSNIMPWRARSNNSVALLRNQCSLQQFQNIVNNTRKFGEPGFIFLDDLNYGYNPCLAGDNHLLTKNGYKTIKELWEEGGKQEYDRCKGADEYGLIDIVNSKGVVKATNIYRTSKSEPIYNLELEDNTLIRATINHTFLILNKKYEKVKRKLYDLKVGDKIPNLISHVQNASWSKIKSIKSSGVEEVFCLTEFIDNEITINGKLIGNCSEIGLNPVDPLTNETGWQTCVSGDTWLLTKDGRVKISEAVDKQIEIWNGEKWASVSPFITGHNKKLYRVKFSDGSSLDCTNNHKFLVRDRFMKEYKTVTTTELDKVSKYRIHVPRSNVNYENCGGIYEKDAYEYGFLLGDGSSTVKNYTGKIYAEATLYGPKINLPLNGNRLDIYQPEGYSVQAQHISFNLNTNLTQKLKNHNIGLPNEIFQWDYQSIVNFISGWADADGSEHNKGCRIYGSKEKIKDLQLLLTKIGINSSFCLMAKKGEKTNLGVRNRDMWYIYAPDARKLDTHRLDVSNGNPAPYHTKWQLIESVEELPGTHTTYCLEEPDTHNCLFNNVITKQCNLSEINGGVIESKEDFKNAIRAATIIGTLQAGFSYFHYLTDVSRRVIRRESLLGVSVTGWMENPNLLLNPELQREMAQYAIEVNREFAELIGIEPAARVTTTKPAGSTSLIFGTSSGIHPHHARYYFRRMQQNSVQMPFQFFKLNNPQAVEKSVWGKNDEVITFCIEVSEKAVIKEDITALEMLKIVKDTYNNWVIPGTADPNSSPGLTHNVSNTIHVDEHEWEEVTQYIYDHRHIFSGIALLPKSGDKSYEQAPNERIISEEDIEKWNQLVNNFQEIDWITFEEATDNTSLRETVACTGGGCEF